MVVQEFHSQKPIDHLFLVKPYEYFSARQNSAGRFDQTEFTAKTLTAHILPKEASRHFTLASPQAAAHACQSKPSFKVSSLQSLSRNPQLPGWESQLQAAIARLSGGGQLSPYATQSGAQGRDPSEGLSD